VANRSISPQRFAAALNRSSPKAGCAYSRTVSPALAGSAYLR
jgi:hypothetical protein